MPATDPFKCLIFDCASQILFFLDIQSLVSCERVSKGWKTFIRTWIAEWGALTHFPGERPKPKYGTTIGQSDLGRAEDIIGQFKYLAGLQLNLKHGKAMKLNEFTNVQRINIAGDYAVWVLFPKIHFQRLGVENGLEYSPQTVPLASNHGQWPTSRFFVNDEGYMVYQTRPGHDRNRSECITHVVSLPKGRRLYEITNSRKPVSGSRSILQSAHELVAVGRRRIYMVNNTKDAGLIIEGFDLRSGQPRYGTRLPDGSSGRFGYAVLRGEGEAQPELLLSLVATPQADTITVVNGDNGHILQTIAGDFGTTLTPPHLPPEIYDQFATAATIHVHSRQRQFAISWRPHGKILVKNFVLRQDSDHLFHQTRSAVFLPPPCKHESDGIDIDPFQDLAVNLGNGNVKPQIHTFSRVPTGQFKKEGDSDDTVYYIPDEQSCGITLPPVSRGEGQGWRPFRWKSSSLYGCVGFGLRFVDGNRILFRVRSEVDTEDVWYLFDFAPDIPRVRDAKEPVYSRRCRLQ